MLIAPDRWVFIHIPKTGGTWLQRRLLAVAPKAWGLHLFNDENPNSHQHHSELPPPLAALPHFAFVRNPFAWYVSMYSMWANMYYHGDVGSELDFDEPYGGKPRAEWDNAERVWDQLLRGLPEGPEGFQRAIEERGCFHRVVGTLTDFVERMCTHETQLFRLEDGLAEGLRSFIGEDYQEVDLIASKAKLNVSRHAPWEEFFAGPTGESIRLKIASSWDPDLLETFYPEFL